MSFEGHYQILCVNGHLSGADCYDEPNFDWPESEEYEGTTYQTPQWTCHCGAKAAWWNLVDTTNGSFCDCSAGRWYYDVVRDDRRPDGCEHCENGSIDGHVELDVLKPAATETCNLGHEHVIEEETYKIPTGRGHLTKWARIPTSRRLSFC